MPETSTQKLCHLDEMLADMRREVPTVYVVSRGWAAGVLETVGENIAWGNSNSGYSAREVGWALLRVFGPYDPQHLGQLVQGYMEAAAFYADATIPDDLAPKISAVGA